MGNLENMKFYSNDVPFWQGVTNQAEIIFTRGQQVGRVCVCVCMGRDKRADFLQVVSHSRSSTE